MYSSVPSYDVLVVGGGHNGLVSAATAAEAGLKVALIERSECLGGAVSTKHFDCGCYINRGANAYGMMSREVNNLLKRHGSMPNVVKAEPGFAVWRDESPVLYDYSNPRKFAAHITTNAPRSMKGIFDFATDMTRTAEAVQQFWSEFPSDATFWEALEHNAAVGGVDYRNMSIRDVCEHFEIHQEDAPVLFAASTLYPSLTDEPGTALPLLYLSISEVEGRRGWGVVEGGFSKITDGLVSILNSHDAAIYSGVSVESIDLSQRNGVNLSDRRTVRSNNVVMAIDPWRVAKMMPNLDLEPPKDEVVHDGGCIKVNMMFKKQPTFSDRFSEASPMIIKMNDLDDIDQAYSDYEKNGFSSNPYIELTLNKLLDKSGDCEEHFTVSAFVLFGSYRIDPSQEEVARESVLSSVLEFTEKTISLERQDLSWSEVLLPKDISEIWGMTYGNVDHGAMRDPNIGSARGFPKAVRDELNVQGIYFGGSGFHPGGLVSGRPGLIATRSLLENRAV